MEVQFDPGFVKHLYAFVPSIKQIYGAISQFKNFNQKKMQFKLYYPKIQHLIDEYAGFYLGCVLWAVCIKQYKGAKILNNLMYGGVYSEQETLSEVDFVQEYLQQLVKDAKYYAGIDYSPEENVLKIVSIYREFLKLNEGFVKVDTTDDIKIPDSVKNIKDVEYISKEIDRVVESGKLSDLLKLCNMVF